jgi:LamB porin.
VDNVRGWQVNGFPGNGLPIPRPGTMSPTAFSRSGNFLKFTIAPTIKPKGGYYTRPELRVFATYSIWSDSLRGATTPIQEGGNTGGWTPSPYANGKAQDGWLIGTQVEWYM